MKEAEKNSKNIYIALGSNISPDKNIPTALKALEKEFGGLEACSSVWRTSAVGSDGPDFLNAIALIKSVGSMESIKNEILRPLENKMGRVRTSDKNSPRTIDLDIMIYEDILQEEELWEQVHMAVPLAEIYPSFTQNEGGKTVAEVAKELMKGKGINRVSLED